MPSEPEPTYSTSEVAAALKVSPATVRRWMKEGFLPEPGWTKTGRRRQRAYGAGWLADAREKLAQEEEGDR